MTANVEGLTAYVLSGQTALASRVTISGRVCRGTLGINRVRRAGHTQTRVVLRQDGGQTVVLYDRLIAAGQLEIRVGRRYVDARKVLAGWSS